MFVFSTLKKINNEYHLSAFILIILLSRSIKLKPNGSKEEDFEHLVLGREFHKRSTTNVKF